MKIGIMQMQQSIGQPTAMTRPLSDIGIWLGQQIWQSSVVRTVVAVVVTLSIVPTVTKSYPTPVLGWHGQANVTSLSWWHQHGQQQQSVLFIGDDQHTSILNPNSQFHSRMIDISQSDLVTGSDDIELDYSSESVEVNLAKQQQQLPPGYLPSNETTFIFMENPVDMTDPFHSNQDFMTIVFTHAITFIIGVIGNSVVIATWARGGKIRSPTATFLVSLACADLLLLIIFMPLETLEYFVITWDRYGYICKMSSFVEMLSGMSSVLNLVAVSVERFLVIVYPIRARRWCTVTKSRRSLFFVWLLAVIFAAPPVFNKSTYSITYFNNETTITAYYCFEKNENWAITFAVYELMVLFVIPALLMIICYCRVIRELWTSTRVITILTSSTNAYNQTTVATAAVSGASSATSRPVSTSANNGIRLNQDGRSYLVRWPTKKLMSISVNCGSNGGGGSGSGVVGGGESVVSNSSTSSGVVPSIGSAGAGLGLGVSPIERPSLTSKCQINQPGDSTSCQCVEPESPISCHHSCSHHHNHYHKSCSVPEQCHCWCKMFHCLRNLRAFFYLNPLFGKHRQASHHQPQHHHSNVKLKPEKSSTSSVCGVNGTGGSSSNPASTSASNRHQNHHRCHHHHQQQHQQQHYANSRHKMASLVPPLPPTLGNSNCDIIKLGPAAAASSTTTGATTPGGSSTFVPIKLSSMPSSSMSTSSATAAAICQSVASLCCFSHLCCPHRLLTPNSPTMGDYGNQGNYHRSGNTHPEALSTSMVSHYQLELDKSNAIRTSVGAATPIDADPHSAQSTNHADMVGLDLNMSRPTLGIINLSVDGNSGTSINQMSVLPSTPTTPFSNQYARRPITDVRNARKQLYCQVIKMLLFIVILFHVCWGPRLIFNVIKSTGIGNFTNSAYSARVYFTLLSFIHSALNPFVYGFMSSNFRRMMLNSCNHHHYHHHHRHHHNNNSNHRYPYNNNSQLFTPSHVANNSMADTGTGTGTGTGVAEPASLGTTMPPNGRSPSQQAPHYPRHHNHHHHHHHNHHNQHHRNHSSSSTTSFHRSHSVISSENERSLVGYEPVVSHPADSGQMRSVSCAESPQQPTQPTQSPPPLDPSLQFKQCENELNEALFNQSKQLQQQQQSRRQSYGKNLKQFLHFRNSQQSSSSSTSTMLNRSLSMIQMAQDSMSNAKNINANNKGSHHRPNTGHLSNVRRLIKAVGGVGGGGGGTQTSQRPLTNQSNHFKPSFTFNRATATTTTVWNSDYEHSC